MEYLFKILTYISTFPLQTRRTNCQCKYPTMRKESSSEIQPTVVVHAQHSPKPLSSSRDCATAFLVSFSLPNPHCISKERSTGEFSPLE